MVLKAEEQSMARSGTQFQFFLLYPNGVLRAIDYGLDLTTMAQANLLTETMRYMLHLPPMQTRQKVEQVKAYFSAIGNPHNPLH